MTNTYANQIQTGTDVYGSDGEKIGSVTGLADNYFVIEKGFIFTTDLYVPMSAVAGVNDDGIQLTMTKDQVENEDWSTQPTDGTGGTTDDTVLERSEERLVVDKDVAEAGRVRVGKHVVEQEQSVDVPVTREEVTINRRAVDRPVGDADFGDETIDVPVYAENVDISKESRVVEELEVGKTQVTDTERVQETVRREEFDIDEDTETTRG